MDAARRTSSWKAKGGDWREHVFDAHNRPAEVLLDLNRGLNACMLAVVVAKGEDGERAGSYTPYKPNQP